MTNDNPFCLNGICFSVMTFLSLVRMCSGQCWQVLDTLYVACNICNNSIRKVSSIGKECVVGGGGGGGRGIQTLTLRGIPIVEILEPFLRGVSIVLILSIPLSILPNIYPNIVMLIWQVNS